MNERSCSREREVTLLARAARLSGSLAEHARGCPACREAASVAGWLGDLSRQEDGAPLPDAGELYRRARLLERLFGQPAPVEDAMRKLAFAEAAGILASAMSLLTGLAWGASRVLDVAGASNLPALLPAPSSSLVAVAVLGLAAFGAGLSLLAAWPLVRAED